MFLNEEKHKNEYKQGKYGVPHQRGTKTEDFLLRYCQNIWGRGLVGELMMGNNGFYRRNIPELRAYARDLQGYQKYQEILDPCDKKGRRYMNINWDTEAILPNLRSAIKEIILEINLEPDIEAVDDRTKKARSEAVAEAKLATTPQIQQLLMAAGMNPQEFVPEGATSEVDIDFIERLGGYRMIEEIEIKDCVDASINTGWDVVKDIVADDLVDLHVVATHMRTGPKGIVIEYVDPARLILPKSKYPDYRDAEFMAFWQPMTIAELREIAVDKDEEWFIKIARQYRGQGKQQQYSGGFDSSTRENYYRANGRQWYDDFCIEVMTVYILCTDTEKYVEGNHKKGNKIYDRVDDNAKLSERDVRRGKRFVEKSAVKLYKANWIIGTDELFDSGENTDNVLDENNTPLFPLIVVSGDGPSPVEKAIPLVDDIHIAIYKLRHAFRKMAPGPRIVIDKAKLRNMVSFGEEKYSMKEMLELYPKTGTLFVESVADFSDPGIGGQSRPFDFMESGIAEDVQLLMTEISTKTERLRTVMAVNSMMDGSNRQPNMLKGVMEGLIMAGNTMNRGYARLMVNFYRRMVAFIGNYWRNAVVYGPESGYSAETLERMNNTSYRYEVRFGLSESDKEMLIQDLMAKRDQGQLAPDAFIVIYNMIKRGDMAKAQLYMIKAVQEERERQQQQQQQAIAMQNQGNMAAAQQAIQGEQQVMDIVHQHKLKQIQLQGEIDLDKAEVMARRQQQGKK